MFLHNVHALIELEVTANAVTMPHNTYRIGCARGLGTVDGCRFVYLGAGGQTAPSQICVYYTALQRRDLTLKSTII